MITCTLYTCSEGAVTIEHSVPWKFSICGVTQELSGRSPGITVKDSGPCLGFVPGAQWEHCLGVIYQTNFHQLGPLGPLGRVGLVVAMFVCLFVPSTWFFFQGLSLALRSHDQLQATHCSTH